jgi:hypothetical protein
VFGRLPWLAAFFFRLRFLRPFLDTAGRPLCCSSDDDCGPGECVTVRCDGAEEWVAHRGWMAGRSVEEGDP